MAERKLHQAGDGLVHGLDAATAPRRPKSALVVWYKTELELIRKPGARVRRCLSVDCERRACLLVAGCSQMRGAVYVMQGPSNQIAF